MNLKYSVGDRVLVISERQVHWNDEGEMDRYFDQVVEIAEISDDWHGEPYMVINDDPNTNDTFPHWYFKESDFVCLESEMTGPSEKEKIKSAMDFLMG